MRKLSIGIILIGLTLLILKSNANSKTDKYNVIIDSLKKKVIDPVCKMKIKPADAKTTVYNKITYHFCSESCKQKFISEPTKYAKK